MKTLKAKSVDGRPFELTIPNEMYRTLYESLTVEGLKKLDLFCNCVFCDETEPEKTCEECRLYKALGGYVCYGARGLAGMKKLDNARLLTQRTARHNLHKSVRYNRAVTTLHDARRRLKAALRRGTVSASTAGG